MHIIESEENDAVPDMCSLAFIQPPIRRPGMYGGTMRWLDAEPVPT